jgi:hypothetical protein
LIKPIKILKKLTGSVRFRFFKPGTGKTEPNKKNQKKTEPNRKNRVKPKKPSQTEPKPSQTEPNRFEPVFSLKSRTEPKPVGLNRFRFGFGFFKKKKIQFGYFFDKNQTEPNREHP